MTDINKELRAGLAVTPEDFLPQLESCATCGEEAWLMTAGAEDLDEMQKELLAALAPDVAQFGLAEELRLGEQELEAVEFEEGLQAEQELEEAMMALEEDAKMDLEQLMALAKAHPGLKITLSF